MKARPVVHQPGPQDSKDVGLVHGGSGKGTNAKSKRTGAAVERDWNQTKLVLALCALPMGCDASLVIRSRVVPVCAWPSVASLPAKEALTRPLPFVPILTSHWPIHLGISS